jgi:integrase
MLQALQAGDVLQAKPSQSPTLTAFAHEHFLPWVEGHAGLEFKSKEGYRYGWMLLASQDIAKMRMSAIAKSDLDGIKVKGSPSTYNCALRTLSRMFSLALDKKLIQARFRIPLLEERERTKLPVGVEEKIAGVLAQSKRHGSLKTALYVILDAGMRPKEISCMDIKDIDFQSGLIRVPDSKTRAGVRYVPMTPRLREKLVLQIGTRTGGWLFPSPRYPGRPIQRQALTVAWRKAANKAGVDADVDLYCARHTFGTDVMEATKNQFKVMKIMGHTTLRTTERYQHHETAAVGQQLDELRNLRHNLRHNGQNGLELVS